MADIYDFLRELEKITIEFEDQAGKLVSLKSYIKSLDEDRILIDAPSAKGISYNLPVGQVVTISIRTKDGGVYCGDSKVIDKELSSISGIWISYPYTIQYVQRREYLRVPLNLNTEIIVYNEPSKFTKQEYNVRLRDICGSGFSYYSDATLSRYYDLECKIHLNDSKNPIVARCEHIYSNKVIIHNSEKYINALIFIDIKKKDIERIVRASFKYQLELKKKGFSE